MSCFDFFEAKTGRAGKPHFLSKKIVLRHTKKSLFELWGGAASKKASKESQTGFGKASGRLPKDFFRASKKPLTPLPETSRKDGEEMAEKYFLNFYKLKYTIIAKKIVSLQTMKTTSKLTILVAIVAMLTSCSDYGKLMKGNDFDAKYQAAMKYYEDKNYTKAIQLYENLIMHYHGKEYAENISWYYAMCMMAEKDYYSAGYQFKSFYKRFAYSERAEEALYQAATCKYYESPEYYLDQKLTKEAIQEYESYLDRYPASIHVPEINTRLDELNEKLMHKAYGIAYNYYETENYHAAYASLQSFLNNYPDSPYREDAMFYLLASGYKYGIGSRESKMKERLQQVVNDFDRFSASFSDSKRLAQAQDFYTKAKAAIARLEKAEAEKAALARTESNKSE